MTKMEHGDIAFPNLNIWLHNVPKNFSVFGFTIALYGCLVATGIMLGVLMAVHDRKSRGLPTEPVWDVITYGIIIGILGARAYYVIFAWDYYKDNLLSIFNLRQGGLAIYGGITAGFITVIIISRLHKEKPLEICDSIALGFPVGQIIGRWGNFFNREAFGGWSENLLSMRLPIQDVRANDISPGIEQHVTAGMDYIQVHPTFLYEGMWNLCVLILLYLYRKHKKFSGEVFFLYLFGYGLGRIWIESLRTDQLIAPVLGVPVSQIVAGACIVASAGVIIFKRLSDKNNRKEQ